MTVRAVEGKQPYTGGTAIEIDENKVISLRLRDENNLIIYDAGDNEIYVDLQLPDELTPTDAFPVGITTGRVIVDNGWDLQGTIICAKTTSGDNIKLLYADEGTLWIDNGTGTFKQIYFKGDVDAIVQAIYTYINENANVKAFLIYGTEAQKKQKLGEAINYYVVSGKIPLLSMDSVTYTLINAVRGDGVGNTDDVYTFSSAVNSDTGKYKEVKVNVYRTTPPSSTVNSYTVTEHSAGGGGGSGDVVGPSSATNGNLAVFDGTTGKLIKDGGAIPTGVPSGGTDGQVLSKVSGNIAWANPSGGDVQVSTQANNIFTSGMKIWGGTEADYLLLTPDSNTAYLLTAGSPTPGGVSIDDSFTGTALDTSIWTSEQLGSEGSLTVNNGLTITCGSSLISGSDTMRQGYRISTNATFEGTESKITAEITWTDLSGTGLGRGCFTLLGHEIGYGAISGVAVIDGVTGSDYTAWNGRGWRLCKMNDSGTGNVDSVASNTLFSSPSTTVKVVLDITNGTSELFINNTSKGSYNPVLSPVKTWNDFIGKPLLTLSPLQSEGATTWGISNVKLTTE